MNHDHTFSHIGHDIGYCASSQTTAPAEERCALCGSVRHDTFSCPYTKESKVVRCVETLQRSGAPRFVLNADNIVIALRGVG